jgi:hypothetical protein
MEDTKLGGALALSPAAVGGRRRKLKLVTRKVARKALKKMGLKMRGGVDAKDDTGVVPVTPEMAKMGGADPAAAPDAPAGGLRRRGGTKRRSASRRRASVFGL